MKIILACIGIVICGITIGFLLTGAYYEKKLKSHRKIIKAQTQFSGDEFEIEIEWRGDNIELLSLRQRDEKKELILMLPLIK